MPDAAAGGGNFSWVMLLFFVVALSLIAPYLIRRARMLRERQVREEASRDARTPQQRLREAADHALVELLETGREISAQIDTKIRLLNVLVKDADRQAARLEALLNTARTVESAEELEQLAASSHAHEAPAGGRDAPASPASPIEPVPSPHAATTAAPLPELHAEVAQLHAQGLTVAEIARRLRRSTAEVMMVLHLLQHSRPEGDRP